MANRKISDLTALTAPATGDLLPIVDISEAAAADKNKKITYGELLASAPAGSAAAPSFSFEGDTNTGIYSPGADQVAISTGGSGRLFVDASGNVGIGATPLAGHQFTVNGSSLARLALQTAALGQTGSDGFALEMDSNGLYFTNRENIPSIFYTNNAERLRITSAGLVGIGTTGPGTKLEVNGDILSSGRGTSFGYKLPDCRVFNPSSGGIFAIDDYTNTRFFINSSGNVGIGTTSPGNLLHVSGTGTVCQLASSNNNNLINLKGNGATNGVWLGTTSSDDFVISSGASATERARIDSSGRLLLGTSSSIGFIGSTAATLQAVNTGTQYALGMERATNDISGPVCVFRKTRSTSNGGNTIVSSADDLGYIRFAGTDGSAAVLAAEIKAQVDGTPGTNDMPGRLVFSTTADGAASPTERMRIDSTGLMTLAGPGIKFPATQVASADPNTLDDYEEGTFTPVIQGGTTVGTATYATQSGSYVKIGRQVTAHVALNWSSGTGTGRLQISGLPFNTASLDGSVSFGLVDNVTLTANSILTGTSAVGSARIDLTNAIVGGGGYAFSLYDASGFLALTVTYFTT